MNPKAHLSTILVLGKDNRFRAYSQEICESAKDAEQAGADVLAHISAQNPTKQFIHRTMPFKHVTTLASLETDH